MPISIRDRLGWDIFIPLFAGMDSGVRSLGYNVYAPNSNVGGTGTGPGGIGTGDGGFDTPDDPTVNTPSITSPTCNATSVALDSDASSSAFGSTNGQTHVASRWMIELLDDEGSLAAIGTGIFIYDSGLDTVNPLTLDLEAVGLKPGYSYAIRVRHKGSGGGWSSWSSACKFAMNDGCLPVPIFWWDGKESGSIVPNEFTPTYVNELIDKMGNYELLTWGTGINGSSSDGSSMPQFGPTYTEHLNRWPMECVWVGYSKFKFVPEISEPKATVVLVGIDRTLQVSNALWAVNGGDIQSNNDAAVIGGYSSSVSIYRSLYAKVDSGLAATQPDINDDNYKARVLVATVDTTTSEVRIWDKGVEVTYDTGLPGPSLGNLILRYLGQGAWTYSSETPVHSEIRVYDYVLTDAQIISLSTQLQNKWNIT